MKSRSVGIFAPSEVLYNPRLLKYSEIFKSKGFEVTIYNPIIGNGNYDEYRRFERLNENVKSINLLRKTSSGFINLILLNLIYKIYLLLNFHSLSNENPFYLNKYWFFAQFLVRKKHDIIIVNLIDLLPMAFRYKERFIDVKIIYDSQELFTGQERKGSTEIRRWIEFNEKKYIYQCDIICSTTNEMKMELMRKYGLTNIYRVRNVPLERYIKSVHEMKPIERRIRFIWHGMTIYFDNERGIKFILDGLRTSKLNFEITLQGNCLDSERVKIQEYLHLHNMEDKVRISGLVHPEKIINSLFQYDVGILAEFPKDQNQLVTSSNKLFDYIHAKLFVIAPNLPGINETFTEYPEIGFQFESGSIYSMVSVLNSLSLEQINKFKEKSKKDINYLNITWDYDAEQIFNSI